MKVFLTGILKLKLVEKSEVAVHVYLSKKNLSFRGLCLSQTLARRLFLINAVYL